MQVKIMQFHRHYNNLYKGFKSLWGYIGVVLHTLLLCLLGACGKESAVQTYQEVIQFHQRHSRFSTPIAADTTPNTADLKIDTINIYVKQHTDFAHAAAVARPLLEAFSKNVQQFSTSIYFQPHNQFGAKDTVRHTLNEVLQAAYFTATPLAYQSVSATFQMALDSLQPFIWIDNFAENTPALVAATAQWLKAGHRIDLLAHKVWQEGKLSYLYVLLATPVAYLSATDYAKWLQTLGKYENENCTWWVYQTPKDIFRIRATGTHIGKLHPLLNIRFDESLRAMHLDYYELHKDKLQSWYQQDSTQLLLSELYIDYDTARYRLDISPQLYDLTESFLAYQQFAAQDTIRYGQDAETTQRTLVEGQNMLFRFTQNLVYQCLVNKNSREATGTNCQVHLSRMFPMNERNGMGLFRIDWQLRHCEAKTPTRLQNLLKDKPNMPKPFHALLWAATQNNPTKTANNQKLYSHYFLVR